LQLAGLQGGISINATPGQPCNDYIYAANGQPIINQTGSAKNWYIPEQVLVTT
jgi:hypothetical protein